MSKKRDYTRYSKGPVESMESVETVVEDVVEPAEIVVEDAVETVTTVEVEQEPKIEEVKVEEPKAEESESIVGIVTDCLKLNVREHPNSTAAILGVITASTDLIIIEEESTKDFYKICTSAGLEGYCMKKFITILP